MAVHDYNSVPGLSRGRILHIRMGINPNSSGFGIFVGAYFFLPPFFVNLLVALVLERRLRRALQSEQMTSSKNTVTHGAVTAIAWALAWAGFFAAWMLPLRVIDDITEHGSLYAVLSVMPCLFLTLIIAYLVWRCGYHPLLARSSGQAAGLALALSLVSIGLFVLLSGPPVPAGEGFSSWFRSVLLPWAEWLGPLMFIAVALALAWVTLHLNGGGMCVVISTCYLIGGLVTLIVPFLAEIPPVVGGMNGVSLYFLLWAMLVPPLATIFGLLRLQRRFDASPESSL